MFSTKISIKKEIFCIIMSNLTIWLVKNYIIRIIVDFLRFSWLENGFQTEMHSD